MELVLEVAPPELPLPVLVELPLLLAVLPGVGVVATLFAVPLNDEVELVLWVAFAEAFRLPVSDFDEVAFREALEDFEAVVLSESVELFVSVELALNDELFIELEVSERVFDLLAVKDSLSLLVRLLV